MFKKFFSAQTQIANLHLERAARIKDSYFQISTRWPSLAEAEKLALCLQDYFGVESPDWRNVEGLPSIDDYCLKLAMIFSVLSSDRSLSAIALLVKNVSSTPLVAADYVELRVALSDAYSMCKRKFCSTFLRNNAQISSADLWANLAEWINHSLKINLRTADLHPDLFSGFVGLQRFDYADLVDYSDWRPNFGVSTAESYRVIGIEGRECSILEVDIILNSKGIALVKAAGNISAFIIREIKPQVAVPIAIHHAAADLIARLKEDRRIPPSADTWEMTVHDLNLKAWTKSARFGVSGWRCSICGSRNSTLPKDVLLTSVFDDDQRWGDHFLLECKNCLRTALVVDVFCVRLPGGRNLLGEEPFTTAAGPTRSEIRQAVLSGTMSRLSLRPDDL